jgi:hypothetical protein
MNIVLAAIVAWGRFGPYPFTDPNESETLP